MIRHIILDEKQVSALNDVSRLAFNRSDAPELRVEDHQLFRKISNTIDGILRPSLSGLPDEAGVEK